MSETETKKQEDLLGKVYQYRENIYILCSVLSAGGKCVGPVLLDTTGMPKAADYR